MFTSAPLPLETVAIRNLPSSPKSVTRIARGVSQMIWCTLKDFAGSIKT